MDVLLGISIVIVYFMFGILTAAIYKVDEPLDVFLAAFFMADHGKPLCDCDSCHILI